jgi:hypothetical protein
LTGTWQLVCAFKGVLVGPGFVFHDFWLLFFLLPSCLGGFLRANNWFLKKNVYYSQTNNYIAQGGDCLLP